MKLSSVNQKFPSFVCVTHPHFLGTKVLHLTGRPEANYDEVPGTDSKITKYLFALLWHWL